MKAHMKTTLLLVLILTMAVTGYTKGAQEETSTTTRAVASETSGSAYPIVTEPLTLTYWVPFASSAATIMSSYAEADAWIEWMELTGITLDFIHPAIGQESQEYQLMIASGDLADIIDMTFLGPNMYPGGNDAAIQDGVYIRLNELVEEYAPNYYSKMISDPQIGKALKTDSGNLWAFQMLEEVAQPAYMGPSVRGDWLEELGLDIPETIDDWHTMLVAFKDKMGAESPFLLHASGIESCSAFIGAYGVMNGFYQTNGEVRYGPSEPGFKAYLTTMNQWYKEGLIYRDFVNYNLYDTSTVDKVATGKAGALISGYWIVDSYRVASEDPDFIMIGAPYPSLEKGQTVTIRLHNEKVRGDGNVTVITTACKQPVEAVKFIDYGYSEKGFLLFNYGVEGKAYTLSDGKPVYTDYVIHNPDFPGFTDMINIAARQSGPFVKDLGRSYHLFPEYALNAQNQVWCGDDSSMLPNTLSLTIEEATKFSTTMSDINTYISEMVPKFIIGLESLNNYDLFVQQIEDMGIEEMIRIKQKSLDRYKNR